MRHILIVAPAFPPANAVGALRPFRFYKFLREFGFEPHVITASERELSGDLRSNLPGNLPGNLQGNLQNITVVRDPGTTGLRRAFGWDAVAPYLGLNRGMHWVAPAVRAARALADRVPLSAVISTVPPVNAHFVGLALKRQRAVPWIADFRDPLFIEGSASPGASVARLLCARWERRFLRGADAVLGVHDVMTRRWRHEDPSRAAKIHWFPNGFDPDQIIEPRPLPARSRKVLLHLGSLYGRRLPGIVLASVSRLVQAGRLDGSRIEVRLVGDADPAALAEDPAAVDVLNEHGCLTCVPNHVPRADALRELAEADYLLLLDNFAEDPVYGLPGKIFEYVRMGRPILAVTPAGSPVEELLARSGVPHRIIRPSAAASAVDGEVAELFRMSAEPVRPSEWFETEYDGRRQVERLAQLVERVTERVACAA